MKKKPWSYGFYYASATPLNLNFEGYFTTFYQVRHIPTHFPFADRSLGPTSFVTTFEKIPHDGKQRQRSLQPTLCGSAVWPPSTMAAIKSSGLPAWGS
ncbi:hypothetical protein LINGRAPRIM_LOCUS438 [Linum grandiflorum]